MAHASNPSLRRRTADASAVALRPASLHLCPPRLLIESNRVDIFAEAAQHTRRRTEPTQGAGTVSWSLVLSRPSVRALPSQVDECDVAEEAMAEEAPLGKPARPPLPSIRLPL